MVITVNPGFINVVVPSTGKGKEEIVTITNQDGERMCFKIKGAVLEKFNVDPNFGFVDAKGVSKIKIKPKAFGADGLAKNDHFTLLMVAAASGDAKEIWARNPANPKRYLIPIIYVMKEANKPNNVQTEAMEIVASRDKQKSDAGSEEKGPDGKPSVFADDEKTLPPEDLMEVPIFQEYNFRRYD